MIVSCSPPIGTPPNGFVKYDITRKIVVFKLGLKLHEYGGAFSRIGQLNRSGSTVVLVL